jgi:protein-S-isoprenylcysteine O-methyltransferase Ste14
MRALELKIPPPVLFLLFVVAMWFIARVAPGVTVVSGLRFGLAGLFFLLSLIGPLGILAFRRAQTTINPVEPYKASLIVSSGVYGVTRNPMYVGLVTLLLSWAAYLASPWTLLGPILFAVYINRFQIIPEERALLAKFGKEYAGYQNKVRRWI